jgi:hypothetical protein
MEDISKKLLKLSLVTLIIAVSLFIINFYFFHFVTDDGFTLTYHEEAGKPFITNLIGNLGILFLFTSIISFIIRQIFYKKN